MKKYLTLLISFLPLFIFSQAVTVSDPVTIRNDQGYEVLGKLKDRFLIYRDKANEDYEIQAFDENLRLSWNKALEFDRKKTNVLSVLAKDDSFNIIYRFKRKGKTIIKTRRYDAGANMIDSITIYDYGSRFYPPRVKLIHSEDKTKVLLYSIEKQSKIEVICFDLENMQLLWTNEFSPEGLTFDVDYQQPLLSNDGNLFFVLNRDNRRSTKNNHLYEVYHANAETPKGSLEFFKFHMEDKMTYDVLFEYDNLNDNIVGGGLYSEKHRGRSNGYFYLSIPVANQPDYKLVFHPFEEKFISDFLGKSAKSNSKGITETVVRDLVLRRDGGILLLLERSKLLERQTLSANRTGYVGDDGRSYIVDYHLENVAVLSIHPTGKIHWETILPKRQYSQDDDAIFSSFFLLKTPKSLRLLFNDEIKYENTVSEYVLRSNGEYDRNSVMSTSYQKLQLRFRDAVQIGASELLIPSERRSKLKLVKISY